MTLAIISNFQYKPRILVFFSNPLFRVFRMSWYSRARYSVYKFLFCVRKCKFSMRALSCPLIQFCPENQGFSPCAYTVSLNFFFGCAFLCIFALFPSCVYRVTKLFFCAHFCAFHVFSPLLPFTWKVWKNCCHAPIYCRVHKFPISRKMPLNATIFHTAPINWISHHFPLSTMRIYRV